MHFQNDAFNEDLQVENEFPAGRSSCTSCLLYTSDAADDLLCVDLGGRRLLKKKNTNKSHKPSLTQYIQPI